jgi:hypothetical protein
MTENIHKPSLYRWKRQEDPRSYSRSQAGIFGILILTCGSGLDSYLWTVHKFILEILRFFNPSIYN